MKNNRKLLFLLVVCSLMLFSCQYIVLPDEDAPAAAAAIGWNAIVTGVSKSGAGDLHIDITIRNDNVQWSSMQAEKQASLESGGKTSTCETVNVGTGGHRLPPSFQMRGYTAGTKDKPETQLLYVECAGAEAASGAKLSFGYSYFTGDLNYYDQEANKSNGRLTLELDTIVSDLQYPVEAPVEGLILPSDTPITGISQSVTSLTGVQRTENGFTFQWQNLNPSEYPLVVHFGVPPVIGADGIIYGRYESMEATSVPTAQAGSTVAWTTAVIAPADVTGFYILLGVESKQMRLYTNYVLDISNQ